MRRLTFDQETLQELLNISRDMVEIRLLEPLLNYTLDVVLEWFDADYSYLILLNEDGGLHTQVGKSKNGINWEKGDEQIRDSIFKKVIERHKSLYIADIIQDNKFQNFKDSPSLTSRSILCVPMVSREQLLGVIYLENRGEKELFNNEDLFPFEFFAKQAAIAIANAILNEKLEQSVLQHSSQLEQAKTMLDGEMISRKYVEIELRKLSYAVEQSPNSVIITNTDGQIEYVNPAFTGLTGYTLDEVKGKNPNIQKSGKTELSVYEDLWQTITQGEIWRGEFVNSKKTGELYWEFATIAPIRDENGMTTHYVAVKEDISERKRVEEQMIYFATVDSLTGIYNRRHMFELAERVFEQAKRYQRCLSVMMIDVDHFKLVNDMYGHAIGDRVLHRVAQYFKEHVRTMDILGRYGGEEFAIIMPETDLAQAQQLAERLLSHFNSNPVDTHIGELPITISIGVAEINLGTTQRIDTLLDQADKALMIAKQTGRNRVAVYETA